MNTQGLVLNEKQEEALKAILCRMHVFLSGPSGSGKNTVLNMALSFLERDGITAARCCAASAGASRIGGTSLHSFFKLPFRLLEGGALPVPDITKLMEASVLIVNYIHACTPPLIDLIWEAVSMAKERGHAVQVIFSGDPMSAISVMDYQHRKQYEDLVGHPVQSWDPFHSRHWEDFGFLNCDLPEDLIHKDTVGGKALEAVRLGDGRGLRQLLPFTSRRPIEDAMWVCATKKIAEQKNEEGLRRMAGERHVFHADTFGDTKNIDCPARTDLELVEEMPVILVGNVPGKGLVSGMVGKISSIKNDHVYVSFPGRKGRYLIEKQRWETESGGYICQLPIAPGFAITAYRARYMRLESANLGGCFREKGLFYSAAASVTSLDRLYIDHNPTEKEASADREIRKWYLSSVKEKIIGSPGTLSPPQPVPYSTRLGLRFGLLNTKPYGNVKRVFICLRMQNSHRVCGITDFTRYVRPVSKMRKVSSDIGDRAYFVTQFLNYVFVDTPERVNSLTEVKSMHVRRFLNDYARGLYGNGQANHTKETINKCVETVLHFLQTLAADPGIKTSFSTEDLFTTRYAYSGSRGVTEVPELAFEIFYDPVTHFTYRDMPPEAVQEMVTVAYQKHPRILMNIALGLCAGLRPSETCVLSLNSLRIERIGKKMSEVFIDLENTIPLRDDDVETGEVKVSRIAKVEPMYLDLFESLYTRYMDWREKQPCDSCYLPLCLDSNGNAMTYDTLRNLFKALMDEVADNLRDSTDIRTQSFIDYYLKYGLGFHALRHQFTVSLVLAGYSEARIMNARGDNSPLSAAHYLRNKGILVEKTNVAVTQLTEWVLDAAKELHKKRKGKNR